MVTAESIDCNMQKSSVATFIIQYGANQTQEAQLVSVSFSLWSEGLAIHDVVFEDESESSRENAFNTGS